MGWYGSSFPGISDQVQVYGQNVNNFSYYSISALAYAFQTVPFSSMQLLVFGSTGGITSSQVTGFRQSSGIGVGGLSSGSFGISVKTGDDSDYSKLSAAEFGCAKSFTVATLPSTSVAQAGDIGRITDGVTGLTFGSSGLGGSSNTPYLVWFNGTVWTVVGK